MISRGKALKEAFTGVNPEVSQFRIFVYVVYIHIPMKKRTKLEPTNRNGLFVGYNETSKFYKIYVLGERKTTRCKA